MVWKYFLIFTVFSNSGIGSNVDASYKLPVTVYYESRCGDSRRFITEQLQPAIQMLHNYLKLELVPFGKAKSIDDGFGGFECQHGPPECLGNLVQDCALDLMGNRSDVEKVAYVTCEMKTQAGTVGNLQCVEDMKIPRDPVTQCILFVKGTMLQLESEYQTSLVERKFVPTVTIGGVFNQQIQDFSQIDLIGTLCSFLKEKPPCAHHYNSLALKYVLHGAVPGHGYKA